MMESAGRAEQISEWSCSMSIKNMAWSTGERNIVALRDYASCFWVKIGQKLWGLMVV